jgi:hypothetical protein
MSCLFYLLRYFYFIYFSHDVCCFVCVREFSLLTTVMIRISLCNYTCPGHFLSSLLAWAARLATVSSFFQNWFFFLFLFNLRAIKSSAHQTALSLLSTGHETTQLSQKHVLKEMMVMITKGKLKSCSLMSRNYLLNIWRLRILTLLTTILFLSSGVVCFSTSPRFAAGRSIRYGCRLLRTSFKDGLGREEYWRFPSIFPRQWKAELDGVCRSGVRILTVLFLAPVHLKVENFSI